MREVNSPRDRAGNSFLATIGIHHDERDHPVSSAPKRITSNGISTGSAPSGSTRGSPASVVCDAAARGGPAISTRDTSDGAVVLGSRGVTS